ncbi:MAG: FAD-dependent oxidoreductase [Pirellulales bacterium]|nr:FAD-dependent oxidoreductase [Pirellulales bacterium]
MTSNAASPNVGQVDYDYVVIGSGFGGSVSACRLTEKGYSVLVLEKGRRFRPQDFPTSNWQLSRWMWRPRLGWRGPFKMTFLRHMTVVSGVGVGGGSLVYANTLPVPRRPFFASASWAHLADWEAELKPHYATALRMLGAAPNPRLHVGDQALLEIASEDGRPEHFHPVNTAVYYGEPGRTVPDPYFDGRGPSRTGCIHCGHCMIGCKDNAKNTLDKNYLYLAEQGGAKVEAECEVFDVRPRPAGGYEVHYRRHHPRGTHCVTAAHVVFSGGVMGTLPLLLKLKQSSLPKLSARLGDTIRSNSESIINVVTLRPELDLSQGVAITSKYDIDEHSSLEIVRYPRGSGFFKLLISPHAPGNNVFARLAMALAAWVRQPLRMLRALGVEIGRGSHTLLFMQTLDSTLRFRRNWFGGVTTEVSSGAPPAASIPLATRYAERMAEKLDAVPFSLVTETLFGTPSTAHILGGCCMGRDADEGVIDSRNRVFNYEGLYVIDGSMISANPGVNPSLTITALAERAMSLIPAKELTHEYRRTESVVSGAVG